MKEGIHSRVKLVDPASVSFEEDGVKYSLTPSASLRVIYENKPRFKRYNLV